jgi:hypothetical protein
MEGNFFIFNFKTIMNRNISRVIKIVVFIFIVAIIDKGLGHILSKLYFSQKEGEIHSLNYVLSDCNADILIFGNSRAQHHYDSHIISAALNMSCYNAGEDGGHCIIFPYAQIKIITERYSPKIIILEFSGINNFPGAYDRLSILLPYYKEYPEIRSLIQLRSRFERIKLMSSIYPFNSDVIDILRFHTNIPEDFNGYIPLKKTLNVDLLKPEPEVVRQSEIRTQVADTNMVNALENIIHTCKRKNISLFIITSPNFHSVNEKQGPLSPGTELAQAIIRRNQVNYFDFSFDPVFAGHPELFADEVHLNEEGATIFSNMVTDSIRKTVGTYAKMKPN